MNKYEYKLVSIESQVLDTIEKSLCKLGANGWDITQSSLSYETLSATYIFRGFGKRIAREPIVYGES